MREEPPNSRAGTLYRWGRQANLREQNQGVGLRFVLDIATRNAVASLVLDELRGTSTTRQQLRALRTPAKSKKVRLGRGKAA